ncbi:glycosyl hydrolase 115 family protein [Rhodohalobacter sp. 8-1]|uniref:glycosyl hydrolase 115 family protein n=1 Tax=Rhodohalobacter sp. 8-1 TaxID=3131972 RepID=UPI00403F19D2
MGKMILSCLLSIIFCLPVLAQQTSGLTSTIINTQAESEEDFPIVNEDQQAAPLRYDPNDYGGVIRAIGDLQSDIDTVSGVKPEMMTSGPFSDLEIIIGTLGKSELIDKMVSEDKLDDKDLEGKWESFVITTVENPRPGVEKSLVVAGSDMRGTIYGIYELSRQLGVSPWYWWADVPVIQRSSAFALSGYYASGEPAVKYRGIFINDEEPAFGGWAREKFGGINSDMYTHMFELILRLRGNYLWPAMWGKAFNEDDPKNPKLADEYGIVMGTSHHEPMMRAQAEWTAHGDEYGNGEWNYLTNEEGLKQFWRDGFERNHEYENLVTLGMRGDGDMAMEGAGSMQKNIDLMERIISDQRNIIEDVTGEPASETPQVWALYKEVLLYYEQGMKVPDDVIILLADDNWGDVRRLPDLNEPKHPGGYGMYYHVDYHGAPRSYEWLNMNQLPHMWEQLQLTYDYGVDKVWVLNVGDLKPMEYPMTFFLDMAWNPDSFNAHNLKDYAQKFLREKVGTAEAEEAADILTTSTKYNSRVTAEMLDENTYNLESGEFRQVRDAYMALEARALRQFRGLQEEYKDSYHQLILFPVQAMANLYDLYYSVAMNRKLAAENDPRANYWADRAEDSFAYDDELTEEYHSIADGKWNHMMDKAHIGYTSWNAPQGGDQMPEVTRVDSSIANRGGGYTFKGEHNVVSMEAEHYYESKAAENTQWTIIPDMGRTLSGLALMPYTEMPDGAELTYKFTLDTEADTVELRTIFGTTLPFNGEGHRVAASINGGEEVIWNINEDLTWENNYSLMYPTAADRIIETTHTLQLSNSADGIHTLTIRPLNPGVVFHKIIIDDGGYEQTHLKMPESPYERE